MGSSRLTDRRKEEIRTFVRSNPGMSLNNYAALLGCSVITIQKCLRETGEDWDWRGEALKRKRQTLGPWQTLVMEAFRQAGVDGLTRNELCDRIGHNRTEWMGNVLLDLSRKGVIEGIGRRGGGIGAGEGSHACRVWALKGLTEPGDRLLKSGTDLPERVLAVISATQNGLTAPEIAGKLQIFSKGGKRAVRKIIQLMAEEGKIDTIGRKWAEEGGAPIRLWKAIDIDRLVD